MILLTRGPHFSLIIACGALGAFFMPFLALTLVLMLNGWAVPREWRSGWLSNLLLALASILFVVLCAQQIWSML